jgi:hypothetical protein
VKAKRFSGPKGRVKISYSLFDNCIGDRKASIFEPEYNGGK